MAEDAGGAARLCLAGPCFPAAERRFDEELAGRLETACFDVCLLQRDRVEGDPTPCDSMQRKERRRAIFACDVAEILACDVVLVVLAGRVPDEGACFELGLADGRRRLAPSGPRLIGLQTDARAAFLGATLDPMLPVPLGPVAWDEDELLASLAEARGGRGRSASHPPRSTVLPARSSVPVRWERGGRPR